MAPCRHGSERHLFVLFCFCFGCQASNPFLRFFLLLFLNLNIRRRAVGDTDSTTLTRPTILLHIPHICHSCQHQRTIKTQYAFLECTSQYQEVVPLFFSSSTLPFPHSVLYLAWVAPLLALTLHDRNCPNDLLESALGTCFMIRILYLFFLSFATVLDHPFLRCVYFPTCPSRPQSTNWETGAPVTHTSELIEICSMSPERWGR